MDKQKMPRPIPYEPNMGGPPLPPPGPSSPLPRADPGSLAFWLFIVFCVVMLALLGGMVVGAIC